MHLYPFTGLLFIMVYRKKKVFDVINFHNFFYPDFLFPASSTTYLRTGLFVRLQVQSTLTFLSLQFIDVHLYAEQTYTSL
jgi:hypothetical protein